MIDHDNLEEFRDPQTYDLEDEGYYEVDHKSLADQPQVMACCTSISR